MVASLPDSSTPLEQLSPWSAQQCRQQQKAAAEIAAAAAAARSPGKGRIGGSAAGSSTRRQPLFVRERMGSGRPLNYYELIGPVKTEDEQQLFHQLELQHSASTGRVADWTVFTRDWNLEAFANVARGGPKVITFKQVSHLKSYSKSLAKAAGQVHAAAMASNAGQPPLEAEGQHVGEGSDTSAVIAALQQILQECVQHHGGSGAEVLQLPDVLQQLLTQSLGTSLGPNLAAAGSSRAAHVAEAAGGGGGGAAAAAAAAAGHENDGTGLEAIGEAAAELGGSATVQDGGPDAATTQAAGVAAVAAAGVAAGAV